MANTASEKAKELISKFRLATKNSTDVLKNRSNEIAINCAIICVDEILQIQSLNSGWAKGVDLPLRNDMTPYWQEVKQHLIDYKV